MTHCRFFRAIVLWTIFLCASSAAAQDPVIKLVALDPYGHWNFKPAAEDMWAFLSRFSRDVATGSLLVDSTR